MGEVLKALNEMWRGQMSNCCNLPCSDKICREDMNEEGGCPGAYFADILVKTIQELEAKESGGDSKQITYVVNSHYELGAGIQFHGDKIRVSIDSGEPLENEPGEFAEALRKFLAEWYDNGPGCVTIPIKISKGEFLRRYARRISEQLRLDERMCIQSAVAGWEMWDGVDTPEESADGEVIEWSCSL